MERMNSNGGPNLSLMTLFGRYQDKRLQPRASVLRALMGYCMSTLTLYSRLFARGHRLLNPISRVSEMSPDKAQSVEAIRIAPGSGQ